jgi:hypothetical protein
VNVTTIALNGFAQKNLSINVEKLFVGGFANVSDVPPFTGFYLDDVSIADLTLNRFKLFEPKYMKEESKHFLSHITLNEGFDQVEKKESIAKQQFIMKPNYERFVRTSQVLGRERKLFISNDMNMKLKFWLDKTINSSKIEILKTRKTSIQLNLANNESQIEFIFNGKLILFIQFSLAEVQEHFLTIFASRSRKLGLKWNSLVEKEFDMIETDEVFDLFTSKLVEAPVFNYFKLTELYINDLEIGLDRSESIFYETRLVASSASFETRNINKFTKENKTIVHPSPIEDINQEVKSVEAETLSRQKLIIAIATVAIAIVLLSILALMVNVVVRNEQKSMNENSNETGRRSENRNKVKNSKFSSKNRLELSLNTTGDENNENQSSSPSSSISFSRLTTSHSLSRNTFQSSTHADTAAQQDTYFEYESATNENEMMTAVATKLNSILRQENIMIKPPINTLFNLNDLTLIKYKLNWLPSINEYKSVLDEFEKFSSDHICDKQNQEDQNGSSQLTQDEIASLNHYLCEIHKQTFV